MQIGKPNLLTLPHLPHRFSRLKSHLPTSTSATRLCQSLVESQDPRTRKSSTILPSAFLLPQLSSSLSLPPLPVFIFIFTPSLSPTDSLHLQSFIFKDKLRYAVYGCFYLGYAIIVINLRF